MKIMHITPEAQKRLETLFRKAHGRLAGLRLEGVVGSCRGSTPVLKPVAAPLEGDTTVEAGLVPLFVAPAYCDVMTQATLDFEGGLMGRGLWLTWPHREGCACRGRMKGEG